MAGRCSRKWVCSQPLAMRIMCGISPGREGAILKEGDRYQAGHCSGDATGANSAIATAAASAASSGRKHQAGRNTQHKCITAPTAAAIAHRESSEYPIGKLAHAPAANPAADAAKTETSRGTRRRPAAAIETPAAAGRGCTSSAAAVPTAQQAASPPAVPHGAAAARASCLAKDMAGGGKGVQKGRDGPIK
eukprot:Hpha_TRINITY_DN6159_c0_g1::TRINITY_DN6159_c0_g1_i1::g.164867::m.164867